MQFVTLGIIKSSRLNPVNQLNQFLLHFFPLFTIFLFLMAAASFFRHINSIRKIEKHMESNRPMDWEKLGKPSIFSGKYSEENVKFREFIDSESESEARDAQMIILWERSKQLKRTMSIVTWSAFIIYFFTIVAVHLLFDRIPQF